MADNTLLQPLEISDATLAILTNNLVWASTVDRRFENKLSSGIGYTLTIRKPNRYVTTYGPALQIQGIDEPSVQVTVDTQAQVGFVFSIADLTMIVREFSARYLDPAGETLANAIDAQVASNYSSIWNLVGTPGTIPNSFASLALVAKRMDKLAVGQTGRTLVLNPDAYWSVAAGVTTLYVQSVAEPALKGFVANLANLKVYMNQNAPVHTNGAFSGSFNSSTGMTTGGNVNGAGQTGGELITNGWTASVSNLFNIGDTFTIGGVHSVNPQNRVSTGELANFVVTAQVSSDSGGNAIIPIAAPIVPPNANPLDNAYQNVDSSPANESPISVFGAANTQYGQSVGYVKDTIGLITVPMELPENVDFKARSMYGGISMSIVRQYDINQSTIPARIDCLLGTVCYYPETGVRLTN
jgi:P22 coat protein - gene protein 5